MVARRHTLLYRQTPDNPIVQNADIWQIDVDARPPRHARPVLERTGDERYPRTRPTGRRSLFRGDHDLVDHSGDEELYVMNADGTTSRQLTHNADFDSAPSWSPDGNRRSLFESARDSGDSARPEAQEKDIYVMQRRRHRTCAGSPTRPGSRRGPEFSPDGTKIAFSSARDGQQEIYVMNADGSHPRQLTDDPARDESPDWQAAALRQHRHTGVRRRLASTPAGARACGAMRVVCHVAAPDRAALGRRGRRRGRPARKPARVLPARPTPHTYDLVLVRA